MGLMGAATTSLKQKGEGDWEDEVWRKLRLLATQGEKTPGSHSFLRLLSYSVMFEDLFFLACCLRPVATFFELRLWWFLWLRCGCKQTCGFLLIRNRGLALSIKINVNEQNFLLSSSRAQTSRANERSFSSSSFELYVSH
jgi:hypothetical protein